MEAIPQTLRRSSRENRGVSGQRLCDSPLSPKQKRKARRKHNPDKEKDTKSIWANFRQQFNKQLGIIRFNRAQIRAYESNGFGNRNAEVKKPTAELFRAKQKLDQAKRKIRIIAEDIKNTNSDHKKQEALQFPNAARTKQQTSSGSDQESEIDVEDVCCSVCGSFEACDENDILLCDYKGCGRAYHQQCLDPPVTSASLATTDEDDDWFCWQCDCLLDLFDAVNEEFETDYHDCTQLFSECAGMSSPLDSGEAESNSAQIGFAAQPLMDSDEEDDDFAPPPETKQSIESDDDSQFDSDGDDNKEDNYDSHDDNESSGDDETNHGDEDSERPQHKTQCHDQVDESDGLVLTGKRKRTNVDYCLLAQHMFGSDVDSDDDAEKEYSLCSKQKPRCSSKKK